ncbi:MAG TPA: hypothetical protein DIS95_11865 [Proteus vulgaris]|nr:type II toxin-antitoxin system YhaV family toxin [Proteus vulgaris]MBW3472901.1 type II toxin-antitoxin system YhaV family toxin [Proteus vulgaris]UBH63791.1 type II toxin-antitoxin system YhaV family toxin [Proteus vulgaris]HCN43072.1 hypothetical protein [Proteus vulgaris]
MKLVNGRYRLFFRFSFKKKIIILVWINDNGLYIKQPISEPRY